MKRPYLPLSIRLLFLIGFSAVQLLLFPAPLAAARAVQARRETITLPTYPWWPQIAHPYFQGTDGRNIYPYPMLDNLSREQTNRTYQTVILENDYLRITFLPELGGKIHEVIDKVTGEPMFYVNHVVKPGLIGMCGAWTSGGVEWNTGPQGHTVSAMQPVPVIILPPEPDGSRSVAIGETERIYGTRWTVVVTLRPNRSFIEENIRIYNPTDRIRPYYFWNCTAAPNTPGFRFIYPMTLGTDHGSEKFFNWPIDHGKDLTRGTNYQDASSIFAWHCDQDFFGSYDDLADRGVVAYANHHQVPGKKAWTWGQGGFGKMHQRDLTDNDGPYNEVQTGPLLTQGEVGRLEPSEAVEWKEWWYPIRKIGPFTFANRDVAVNSSISGDTLRLRMIGTGTWVPVEARVRSKDGTIIARTDCRISPRDATEASLYKVPSDQALVVELVSGEDTLARFSVPLTLPVRKAPDRKPNPETAAEFCQKGWEELLFAKFAEAESFFQRALEKDSKLAEARAGLAFLKLDRDPAAARADAEIALRMEPELALAHFALATSMVDANPAGALEHAWKAALDPAFALPARAAIAKVFLRGHQYLDALTVLSQSGPWQTDPSCRNRQAFAHLMLGHRSQAAQSARASLSIDPLDTFAMAVLWLGKERDESARLHAVLADNPAAILDLAAQFKELRQEPLALRILREFYLQQVKPEMQDPLLVCWAKSLNAASSASGPAGQTRSKTPHQAFLFPWGQETLGVLQDLVARNPQDGQATLYLGELLFQMGRTAEARAALKRAAELGASPVVAYRALGMASLTLDKDAAAAADFLKKANAADPADAIVARDFARVLLNQADQRPSQESKQQLYLQARDILQSAFESGRSRSDYVCLLARTLNRMEQYAESARLLDSVRITVWEGSHEAHDLFEEAHLALGRADLKAGRAADALKEFDRALEYPANLAIGKLENAREGHIQKLRADALAALGKEQEAAEARGKGAN